MPESNICKKIRLDKWLWAARFFKTRSLAKVAIEGGKVKVGGKRVKASYELKLGDSVKIAKAWNDLEVSVLALSNKRRGATHAQTLYQETDASISNRNSKLIKRKLAGQLTYGRNDKPDRNTRRKISHFKKNL